MVKSQSEEMKTQSAPAPIVASSLPRSSPLNLDVKKEPAESDSSSKFSADSQKLKHQNHSFHGHEESDSVNRSKRSFDKTLDKNCLQPDLYKFSRLPNEGNLPSTLQSHPSNPYLGLMPGKTRIRTSFDPEHEIPRLQKWFSANQHPTREQMMRFMQELNGLESRKGRRPLDLTNIIYWFKNARAAQRRATRALDDSFENEENIEMNSVESGSPASESVPPFLPNKNAVYMIPFHPYPHLMPSVGDNVRDRDNLVSGTDVDEPYDLSLTKRPSSEISKTNEETDRSDNHFLSLSSSPSPTKSSSASSECENQSNSLKKKKPFCPPRFPALLDVASKMRQEIPHRSDDIYFTNGSGNNSSNQNNFRVSLYRSTPGSIDMEHSIKNEDIDSNFSDPPTPFQNGDIVLDKFSASLKMKHEENEYFHHLNSRKNYRQLSHTSRNSGLELGQVKKENDRKGNSSDEDDESSNDSYNSEEELKLRIKQNAAAAAVVDYASAMHSNVSRLTAANMAALSLAQMGQPLHIPQLTSSLAMAYYPMDPRFYSQPAVPHSLSASPPTSLAATHTSHLSQLTLRQSQDCTHIDSRSPLSSPSLMQQSLNQLNHHQHQQQQTRVFIDPLTEIPKLEKWFTEDTHPSAFMIDKYCEELNKCEYRHKFPKLEPKNVQLWFKNHRAKVKRMKVSGDDHADHNGTGGHDDDIDD
ncbi:unnamed protein product [Candidula unifasciata]|uniref:Homeobox domain-containing protein n=1 Tax=Candidula unifasciata TaxID=100452 RepID=A0A8S3ZLR2_9EUPU|nr:unnamed protein product [Candidula unifasciata]